MSALDQTFAGGDLNPPFNLSKLVSSQPFGKRDKLCQSKSVKKFTDYNLVTKLDSDSKLCLS